MAWLTLNWRWAGLNLFAVSILIIVLSQGSRDWNAVGTFDPGLESGKWAIRFLLICLAMTPLKTYFGWSAAIKLRKPAGLWSFGFALLHVLFYLKVTRLAWLAFPIPTFITLGLLGLLILSALALTSNHWAMRRMRKSWKRLHRLVYLAGPAVVFHAILATNASKKILVRDSQAIQELKIYLALLVVLLVVRIPSVRRVLKLRWLRPQRQTELPAAPVAIPDGAPEYRPWVNGHKAGISYDDLLAEVQPEEDIERLPVIVN